jgi:Nif11 domain
VHQLIWLASIQKQKESLASFPSVNNPEKSHNKTTKYKDKNPMSSASLNQFHNQVMQDSALQEQFKTATDPAENGLVELEEPLLNAIVGGSEIHFKGRHGNVVVKRPVMLLIADPNVQRKLEQANRIN